jgi:hypothetical protein
MITNGVLSGSCCGQLHFGSAHRGVDRSPNACPLLATADGEDRHRFRAKTRTPALSRESLKREPLNIETEISP